MDIYIKEAAPSLGKSYGALQYIKGNKNKNFIVAAISKVLCKQLYETLIEIGEEDVLLISSDQDYINGTFNRFKDSINTDEARVVIITHRCLEMSYKQDIDFSGRELIIDEVPTGYVDIKAIGQPIQDETTMMMQYLVCTGEKQSGEWIREVYRLKKGKKQELEERLAYLKSSGDKTINTRVCDLYEYLLLGGAVQRWQKDTNTMEANYLYIRVINPLILFKSFDKITLLAANIKTSLVSLVWEYIFKIKYLSADYIQLKRDVLPNTDRITIYPLLPEGNELSRYIMDTEYNGENIFTTLKGIGMNILKEDYLYVFNNYREDIAKGGLQAPVQSHGLNCYSHLHKVLCLFSYNPDKFTREILIDLATHFNLPENIFVDGYIASNYLESSFQIMTRCSIRQHNRKEGIQLVVGDYRCANYLRNTWFTDAEISGEHTFIKEDLRKNNKGRPPSFPKVLHMTSSEKSKFYRWEKKQDPKPKIGSNNDYTKVKAWLLSLRRNNG